MSVDPNKFGLTPSLVETVKEALKGNQHKLDVAEPKGKLTSADFKKLRGEGAKPDYLDFDKDGNKKEPMKKALKDKEVKEVADGNSKNFKANMKEGPDQKDATNPKQGSSVDPKQRNINELSKATLGSYVKKSAQDLKNIEAGREKNAGYDKHVATNRMQDNRTKGISRAVGKLTKEEAEQTDEAMSPKQKAYSARVKNNPGRKGVVIDPKSNFNAPDHKVDVVVSKDDKKETKQEVVQAKDKHDAMFKVQMKYHKMGYKVHDTKHKGTVKEEVEVVEAAPAGAPGVTAQLAAKKDALKTQIQRKIAQKQMQVMQAKANKRISGMGNVKEGTKCSCGDTNESKMRCEMHGGKHDDKKGKGGREAIVMNPPLKEASNLPKSVIKKGHEIAKSLIKNKSSVREPYAVGMAAAKKSAGIKEDAEQVDEISTMKAVRTAVKRQSDAYGSAIERGDDLSDKEKHKVNRSQALIKKKYGEKGDKIVHKAVGKRIGYQD